MSTAASGQHRWIKRFGLHCCQWCGYVKRNDGKPNKPCKGKVRLALRENRITTS